MKNHLNESHKEGLKRRAIRDKRRPETELPPESVRLPLLLIAKGRNLNSNGGSLNRSLINTDTNSILLIEISSLLGSVIVFNFNTPG